ncbi:MAG: hypothetical protein ACJAS1_000264 [Oleiphilaceae bacterium]|jgi:hypothetical protein
MDVNSSVTSIAFTKDLIISGNRKMIKVGEIVGFGNGDFHYTNLTPALTCVVKKVHSRYTLLNENDLRVKLLLEQYDSSTMVEVFEISSAKDADKISFLAGELIPHQATNTKFSDLFEKIVTNKQYQKWVNTYFTTKKTRANSQVSFDLSSFIKTLGKNAPSKITLDRIIKDVKNAHTKPNLSPTSTPPTQIDKHQAAEIAPSPANNLQTPHDTKNAIPLDTTEEPEASKSQYMTDEKPSEPPSKHEPEATYIDVAKNNSQQGLSNQKMQEVWDTYSESKYSYQEVRELLINNGSKTFTERLNTIKPGTPEFLEFARKLVDHLNEPSSHE